MYINTQTLQVKTESEIRSINPNTSFPVPFVAPEEYAYVFPSPKPDYNPIIQSITELTPELTLKGTWEQRWEVVELFKNQTEKNNAIALDTEAKRLASIPQSVSMRQASIALELAGLLDDVEAIVATLPRIYQIEWQRASVVFRDNPLVEMVCQEQGMTEVQIDDLFIQASGL